MMFGGAEVELEESIGPPNPVDDTVISFLEFGLGGLVHPGRVWQPGMGFGNRENVMHLSFDRGKENGETKKFINPKQWHGALCDTKFAEFFIFFFDIAFSLLTFSPNSPKKPG